MKILGVIPARFKSSRFPGKPLADIHGKPMIAHVYENAMKVSQFDKVLVATDDERIASECTKHKMQFVMTSAEHKTGTDRVAEVAEKHAADFYVNIQGDEPLVSPDTIESAIQPVISSTDFDAINLMTEIRDSSDVVNSTVPKVVVNIKNEAIFFSRSPIPYPKNKRPKYYKQVCVYVFKRDALKRFVSLERGPIEQSEDIEMLRFLENRMTVRMVEVHEDSVAVDTVADLEIVRNILVNRKG
jgi:3-deoxy-manno-octulosonate cytidylyltransferase (CMP-KDO synthetase)